MSRIRFTNSSIDWNELYPHFSTSLKDLMWEEAKPLLAHGHVVGNNEAPYTKRMSMGARRAQQAARNRQQMAAVRRRANGHGPRRPLRSWMLDHPGERLVQAGRKFRINKSLARRTQESSAIGIVWRHLQASKNDTITLEGLYALAKGAKLNGTTMVAHLYANRQIDPEGPPAKSSPSTGALTSLDGKAN